MRPPRGLSPGEAVLWRKLTATVKPLGNSYLGDFKIGSINQSKDTLGWSFKVNDKLLDSLGPKDVLVQKYEVTINDGKGGKATTVVTVTIKGTDDKVEIQRCYDLGCNVYITKPVEYESFADAIRQLGLFLSVMQAPDIE